MNNLFIISSVLDQIELPNISDCEFNLIAKDSLDEFKEGVIQIWNTFDVSDVISGSGLMFDLKEIVLTFKKGMDVYKSIGKEEEIDDLSPKVEKCLDKAIEIAVRVFSYTDPLISPDHSMDVLDGIYRIFSAVCRMNQNVYDELVFRFIHEVPEIRSVKQHLAFQPSETASAIQFYMKALCAKEVERNDEVGNQSYSGASEHNNNNSSELYIGSFSFIVADESGLPDGRTTLPHGTGCTFLYEIEDVDSLVDVAVKAGAVSAGKVTESFCGSPPVKLTDPYGNVWLICPAEKGPSVKPVVLIRNSKIAEAIDFYKFAFGAEVLKHEHLPFVSAELKVGSFIFVVSGLLDGTMANGTGCTFWLETDDSQSFNELAVKAGATSHGQMIETPNEDEKVPYVSTDPYGNDWFFWCPKGLVSKKSF